MMRKIEATAAEIAVRDQIISELLSCIESNSRIPMSDPRFAGSLGSFFYFFEGEDDLLHLGVSRSDGAPLAVEDAQQVALFLMPDLPPGVLWVKPGTYSQHFYFGHDELL
ncbi:MAG TPA: hypothetical protein VGL56_05825 [Fimbriimonadaceae bacterium]|jgi:hypothetical protein